MTEHQIGGLIGVIMVLGPAVILWVAAELGRRG